MSACERTRAARCAAEIPGVVARAIDRIVALPVGEHQRHIRLAEHDRAGRLEPSNRDSIVPHWDALRPRNAQGGGKTGDVGALLDGHRHAQQRSAIAAPQRPVGFGRRGARALEVAHHHCIELAVVRLDARNRAIEQFNR